jgi:hypothetical protein
MLREIISTSLTSKGSEAVAEVPAPIGDPVRGHVIESASERQRGCGSGYSRRRVIVVVMLSATRERANDVVRKRSGRRIAIIHFSRSHY